MTDTAEAQRILEYLTEGAWFGDLPAGLVQPKPMTIKKLLNEPLAHFFVLGLLLFVLYAAVNNDSSRSAEVIVIDQVRMSGLISNFERTWQRPPTAAETQSLIDAWVREEILYREGVAIGFDLDDPVIRRRVAQKMSFVADGVVPDSPAEEELEIWLAKNVEDYMIPAQFSLQQVYVDPQRHPDDFDAFVDNIRTELENEVDAKTLGDSTLLPTEMQSSSTVELARVFGSDFAESLVDIPSGDWQGPVRSGYGLHMIKISEYIPAREPVLEEVRTAVERDLLSDQSTKINEAFYTALSERYTVRIETVEEVD